MLFFALHSWLYWSQERKPTRGDRSKNETIARKEKPPVDQQIKRFTLELNLNEIQQLQIRQVLLDQEKRFLAFKPEEKPNPDEMENR